MAIASFYDAIKIVGAGGRSRTGTVLLPPDFESSTSANSITPASVYRAKNMIARNATESNAQKQIFVDDFFEDEGQMQEDP